MKYARELDSLLRYVQKNPGLACSEMQAKIRAIPWEGRYSLKVPATTAMNWKLRYLELAGDVVVIKHKWYPTHNTPLLDR